MLAAGFSIPQVAEKPDLKANTLYKVVRDGRIHKPAASNVGRGEKSLDETTAKTVKALEQSMSL